LRIFTIVKNNVIKDEWLYVHIGEDYEDIYDEFVQKYTEAENIANKQSVDLTTVGNIDR
jgi:hypothetical protein